jgi:hypothetical protein
MSLSISQIVESRNKKAWSEFLFNKKESNEKRPLMARGYEEFFNEKHETHEWHIK